MIYHSKTPIWLSDTILTMSTRLNHSVENIDCFDGTLADQNNIAFIPIYGEEELNEEWELFFNLVASKKQNIGKNFVLFFCGVYDFCISEDLTIIKQIKYICKYSSISFFCYPIKIDKIRKNDIDHFLFFYRHLGIYKTANIFQDILNQVIFDSKDSPLINTKHLFDATSQKDGYSNIFSHVNKETLVCFLNNFRKDTLILNRIKNHNLIEILSHISNHHIKNIQLKSNKLQGEIDFNNFPKVEVLILTANLFQSFDFSFLPQKAKFLNLSKNQLKHLVIPNIGDFLEFERLSLFNNGIENLKNIGFLKKLKYINIGLNPIKNFPTELLYCKEIENINISLTQITTLPKDICNLERLETLDISYCQKLYDDEIIKKLKEKGVKIIQ